MAWPCFSTRNHVMIYNPSTAELKLEGGTVLCGFQKGNWFKEAQYTAENPLNPTKDILYELTDACSITVASGSRWAAQTTTIGVQLQEAQKNDAAAKVLYYNMVQKPTAANPNYFELEICHKMYWQVQPTTVLKVEQGGGRPPSKVSHDNAVTTRAAPLGTPSWLWLSATTSRGMDWSRSGPR